MAEISCYAARIKPRGVTMRIIVTEIEASVNSSIGCNLKLLGQEPIACVRIDIQRINLLLVYLGIKKLIAVRSLIVSHVRF